MYAYRWGIKEGSPILNIMFRHKAVLSMFASIGHVSSIIGAALYSYYYDTPVNEYDNSLSWKVIARIIVTYMIYFPFTCLFLIPLNAPFVVILVFSAFLPIFFFCLLIFGPTKYVLFRLNLLPKYEGDFEQVKSSEFEMVSRK